jgi:hypothetical protein
MSVEFFPCLFNTYHRGCIGAISVPMTLADGNRSAISIAKIPEGSSTNIQPSRGISSYPSQFPGLIFSEGSEVGGRGTVCRSVGGCICDGSCLSCQVRTRLPVTHILPRSSVLVGLWQAVVSHHSCHKRHTLFRFQPSHFLFQTRSRNRS